MREVLLANNTTARPVLYILCGLPFSGKTTLARHLVDRLGFASVSIDQIRLARGFTWSEDEKVSPEQWREIFEQSFRETEDNLRRGISVLYDSANQDRFSRDRLRAVARRGHFLTCVIFLDVPITVLRQRWERNRISKERFDLPERFFQAALDTFESPTEDEHVIRYDQLTPIDEWIKSNFERP